MQWLGRRIGVRAQDFLRREREHDNKNKALRHSGLLPNGDTPLPEWIAGTPRHRDDSEVNVWCPMIIIKITVPLINIFSATIGIFDMIGIN